MTSGSGENQVEYDIEEEVETETEENQVEHEHDAETEEEQSEKNNDHEVEDLRVEKTNMKHNYKRNDLPFTCVESEDFCNMIYFLRKDAFIPSADTVKNYIMIFYEDSHKKIALILQNTSSKISFTIDAWTSSNNYSFLGITAYWVTES
ncbi:ribonuclease H-like protein [Rhizophagus clarus]|uniref:Ribonuclease H-like protein n=1 Tax=Rhizophagus clarus TaxID=94130 RepID=A0A8H3LAV4_9GLOM|nr:ribonuclease H-like protein [Rhizophagus clarus]